MNSNASPTAQIASLFATFDNKAEPKQSITNVSKQVVAELGTASITYLSRGAAAAASTVPSTANCNKLSHH
ncbi:unnamed protein product [Phytophthora lilii]|uniref:Unnamed protein product n=1 Tax=Phytophthora lilii TaxID=2077276 RepID=A0A9W6WQL5_9STRA|nr:unnamed protein product [Phytophthora lilii]